MNRYRLVSLAACAVGAGIVLVGPAGDLGAGTRAIALVVLAGVGALIAGLLRRAVAVLVLLSGAGMVFGGTATAIIGGLLVIGGGAVAVITCGGWSAMGARYARGGRGSETDMWAALDRGEDPTAS